MEIDLLVLVILVWSILNGWKRRGLTSLMDVMAVAMIVIVLLDTVPASEGLVLNQVFRERLLDWVQQHVMNTTPDSAGYFQEWKDIPVGAGIFNRSAQILHALYTYSMVTIFGMVLFISVHMVRKAYLTVWNVRFGLWDSKLAGACIGGFLGIMLICFITTIFGILTWFQGFEWLDQSMVQSIFVRCLSSYDPI